MNIGAGVTAEQEPPIVAAGFTPVQLNNVTATDLAGLHVLFVQNSSPNAYGTEYLASKAAVQDAVNAGLVLIIHDRFVGPSPAMTRNILPLPAGVMPVATRVNSQNNSVTDPATFVANGPGGIVTELNLDNGMNSNMGFVNLSTVTVDQDAWDSFTPATQTTPSRSLIRLVRASSSTRRFRWTCS